MTLFKKIQSLIVQFFDYLEREESIKPIAFFRVNLGIFAIIKIAVLYDYLEDVYGQYGYIQWAISKAGLYNFLPHIGDVVLLINNYFAITASQTLYLMFWVYISFLLMLTVGFLSRLNAIVCFILHLMWVDTGAGFMYGVDVFTQMAFFYLIFMPCGRYFSLDVLLRISRPQLFSKSAGLTRKLVQIQMMLVYCSSGIEKGFGVQWRNGEAMWRSLMLPSFQQFDMSWLSGFPALMYMFGWSIILIELLYPLLMSLPQWRILGLILIILMHLSIGVFLGMWLFAYIMIILSVFAFGYEALKDIRNKLAQGLPKSNPQTHNSIIK